MFLEGVVLGMSIVGKKIYLLIHSDMFSMDIDGDNYRLENESSAEDEFKQISANAKGKEFKHKSWMYWNPDQLQVCQMNGEWVYVFEKTAVPNDSRTILRDYPRSLYRVNYDGEEELFIDSEVFSFNLSDDTVYYAKKGEKENTTEIYLMDVNSNEKKYICQIETETEMWCTGICAGDDVLVCIMSEAIVGMRETVIYVVNIDGTGLTMLE